MRTTSSGVESAGADDAWWWCRRLRGLTTKRSWTFFAGSGRASLEESMQAAWRCSAGRRVRWSEEAGCGEGWG